MRPGLDSWLMQLPWCHQCDPNGAILTIVIIAIATVSTSTTTIIPSSTILICLVVEVVACLGRLFQLPRRHLRLAKFSSRDSSAGRASDRRSEGPRFDPGSRQRFKSLWVRSHVNAEPLCFIGLGVFFLFTCLSLFLASFLPDTNELRTQEVEPGL